MPPNEWLGRRARLRIRRFADAGAFVGADGDDAILLPKREVTAVTGIGAFVDWGLDKELLVPFAEQSKAMFVGERQPIGLYVDHSGRLAGTMFVTDLLGAPPRHVARDAWFEGEAWRNDPDIGLFAILERSFVGLVPAHEPHVLRRGQAARFRVAHVLPDGKLVLSLRQHAYQEAAGDAARVLAVLSAPGAPRVGDRSQPDDLRDALASARRRSSAPSGAC